MYTVLFVTIFLFVVVVLTEGNLNEIFWFYRKYFKQHCFSKKSLMWCLFILDSDFLRKCVLNSWLFCSKICRPFKSYILAVKRKNLTSDYVKRFWPSWFTRASVLIVVAFGLCHTLRLITNFIEMFCERLSLPRVSKPRTSEDMDGTLQDLQGPIFFWICDFSYSNTDFELWR